MPEFRAKRREREVISAWVMGSPLTTERMRLALVPTGAGAAGPPGAGAGRGCASAGAAPRKASIATVTAGVRRDRGVAGVMMPVS